MIKGVNIIPLKRVMDERGMVMQMMRNDSQYFTKFGEIYFSVIFPGAIKAWHLHKEMMLVLIHQPIKNCRRFLWGRTITVWYRFLPGSLMVLKQ